MGNKSFPCHLYIVTMGKFNATDVLRFYEMWSILFIWADSVVHFTSRQSFMKFSVRSARLQQLQHMTWLPLNCRYCIKHIAQKEWMWVANIGGSGLALVYYIVYCVCGYSNVTRIDVSGNVTLLNTKYWQHWNELTQPDHW